MAVHGLLYTEADIERLLEDPRFVAAVHGYSLDIYPLGEVAIRWANGRQPRLPRGIEIGGYEQLFHEVAERMADGRIKVDESVRREYRDCYDPESRKPPNERFDTTELLKFSELKQPDVKKIALQLFRRTYDETDIQELIKDRRFLAGVDAWRKSRFGFLYFQRIVYGDPYGNPRDLQFQALHKLGFEVVRRIESGQMSLPANLEEEFPEIYQPPGNYGDSALN